MCVCGSVTGGSLVCLCVCVFVCGTRLCACRCVFLLAAVFGSVFVCLVVRVYVCMYVRLLVSV